jgi:hypothetical protein
MYPNCPLVLLHRSGSYGFCWSTRPFELTTFDLTSRLARVAECSSYIGNKSKPLFCSQVRNKRTSVSICEARFLVDGDDVVDGCLWGHGTLKMWCILLELGCHCTSTLQVFLRHYSFASGYFQLTTISEIHEKKAGIQ